MTAADRLAAIEARANAATEGPWESSAWPSKGVSIVHTADRVLLNVTADADAEFIEHARQDVPALTAALKAVLDLHQSEYWGDDHATCSTCWSPAIDGLRQYPCPTVRAVNAALGVES